MISCFVVGRRLCLSEALCGVGVPEARGRVAEDVRRPEGAAKGARSPRVGRHLQQQAPNARRRRTRRVWLAGGVILVVVGDVTPAGSSDRIALRIHALRSE